MIPNYVKKIIFELQKRDFEAYIVGGCVRDLLLGQKPQDWDLATNARPEQIQEVFPKSFYKNKFGTVTVQTQSAKLKAQNHNSKLKTKQNYHEVEVTTYRIDEKYSDKRHPDKVQFTDSLKEDLARRDFTINSIAMSLTDVILRPSESEVEESRDSSPAAQNDRFKIIDPFNGQKDLEKKLIRAVGEPRKRFNEDALRLMRAVRFAVQLNFKIETKTLKAIKENASDLRAIAKERIRDELIKIIMSDKPDQGILYLKDTGLLSYIIPELEKGVGVSQNRHHIYTIFEHSVLSLKFAAQNKYPLEVRLAALFHDIAKPQTKQGQGPDATFYAHDILGAKFSIRILERLRFPKKIIEKTAHLVRCHMFFYDDKTVTEAGVRRLLRRVGPESFDDLMKLRIADRLGSGCPKAKPYKLRHLEYLIEKVSRDPISPKMIKINGSDIMKILKIQPGPRIGLILNSLLSEILDDPKKNTRQYLTKRVEELNKLSDEALRQSVKKVIEKKEEVDLEIKKKHWVK